MLRAVYGEMKTFLRVAILDPTKMIFYHVTHHEKMTVWTVFPAVFKLHTSKNGLMRFVYLFILLITLFIDRFCSLV